MAEVEHFDVVVIGGGAGGVAAAAGAARAGARVRLVEQYPYLGGAATISSVLTFCGFYDQRGTQVVAGIGQDVLERLRARGVYEEKTMGWTGNRIVLLDLESTKIVCDELLADEGVDVRLHSRLIDATRHEDGIAEVEVHHRGGRERITAAAFVDASGDGALLSCAGVPTRVVPVEDRQTSTLVCRFGGVAQDADLSREGLRSAVAAYSHETGVSLARDYGIAVHLPVSKDVIALLVDEQVDALDAAAISRDEASARRQAWLYLDALRKHLSGWAQAYLVETGPQLGIRESRRLDGRCQLSEADVLQAVKRPQDSIGRCGWPIEDHSGPGVTNYRPIDGRGWYDIPYGAIRARETDNLWAVGRLTSSDDEAYASVRVMGTAFATGHAAGVAAAQYSQGERHDIARIRAELRRQDALV
ncbi:MULTISPECIES: FAD-dependent oxidoreductase [Prauserella salsuginis group]|uniref:FAD-dependent oxidoreductase n=1 Tax=Prauserella salsuginis TaxID=387889 RepID=A0ABW6G291_9PSEU|nr:MULTISPECIES: FAD-dependent oxidoreductase [Prauserella salsuginis group]MCR3719932.1 FAD dependent oxidoreductase [Prauserella flava]MCR3736524.1 FAD dependent oxidoreductase [Prauserella salsuginis]